MTRTAAEERRRSARFAARRKEWSRADDRRSVSVSPDGRERSEGPTVDLTGRWGPASGSRSFDCHRCGAPLGTLHSDGFARAFPKLSHEELAVMARCLDCLRSEPVLHCVSCGNALTVTRAVRLRALVELGRISAATLGVPRCVACLKGGR